MNYSAVLGHTVTPAVAAVLDKITAHVERIRADHPEIPEQAIWDNVLRSVERSTNTSPITAAATAAAMIAPFNEYLDAHADQPFNVLVESLEGEIKTALHLPADT